LNSRQRVIQINNLQYTVFNRLTHPVCLVGQNLDKISRPLTV
jgi:hypothetical protein